MIDLAKALTEVVGPALTDVFRRDELSSVTVTLDPELEGGSLTLSLLAKDETFFDIVVQGNASNGDWQFYRDRLRSNLADFVSESRFGWGENREEKL